MNILLDAWATTMWRACWQGGLVVLVVWTICRLLPSMPARFQSWLWRLAVLKFMAVLMVPTMLNLPLLPAHRAPERITEITVLAPAAEFHQEPLNQRATLPIPMPILPAVLVLVWIIGMGWSLLRLLTAWRDARRLLRERCIIKDTSLMEQLASQGRPFGLRSLPRLLEVDGDGSPMLIGIFRPTIVVPATTLGRLSISEQTMVLGHELAHVKRGDLFWSIAATVVQAIFFFHPLVWLARRRVNLLQEMAADELAIAQQKHDPVGYGKLLVSIVGKLGPARLLSPVAMGTTGSVRTLTRRLVAMKLIGQISSRMVVMSGILVAAVVVVGLVPWRLVAAEPREGKPSVQRAPADKPKGHIEPTADQAKAIAEIKKLGGKVTLDEKSPGKPVIDVVDLESTEVTDAWLEHLKGLTTLRFLDLMQTKVTDAGLEHLKGLTNLHGLALFSTNVTDAGLVHLKGLTNLTMLDLRRTKVTDAGLEHLKRLTELQYLLLDYANVSNAGLEHFKGLTELQYLYLRGTKVTDVGLEYLKGLTRLQILDLSGTQVTNAGLVHLKGLTKLAMLDLQNTNVSDAGLEHLKGLTEVEILSLEGTHVTDAGLEHLKRLSHLENLRLQGTKVSDEGVKNLQQALPKCKIHFRPAAISTGGSSGPGNDKSVPTAEKPAAIAIEPNADEAKAIVEIKKLGGKVTLDEKSPGKPVIEVGLDGTKVTDADLNLLKGLSRLQRLDLDGPNVTDAGVESLKGLGHLQTLCIDCPQVTDVGLEALKGLSELVELTLNSTRVTEAGLSNLKSLNHLRALWLQGTPVTGAGLEHLNGLSQLQTLGLEGTEVTDAGLKHLEGLRHLRTLDLSHNQIADTGLKHLKDLSQLQLLDLTDTLVTDAGLENLKGLVQLQKLGLVGTKVTDDGVKGLQQALPKCKILH